MTAARRTRSNFGLQRAVELANELGRPLLILEALRCDYPWANDRLHHFILDGMAANAAALGGANLRYYPYVEPSAGRGRGLVRALSRQAAAIVCDWFPSFFIPRMLDAAARQVAVRLETVDSNGLIPLSDHGKPFTTARAYRAFVQRAFRAHARMVPDEQPLDGLLPALDPPALPDEIERRWPAAAVAALNQPAALLAMLPLDHTVAPVPTRGGGQRALQTLRRFVDGGLGDYGDAHNHPDLDGTSHLSPYLHFGHLSAHDVFAAVMTAERWTTRKLASGARGAREGWWGVSPSAEAFLDQLVVWRELTYNGAHYTASYGRYETLPAWARGSLAAHRSDPRPHLYDIETLDRAETGDEVWNAAMRQLKAEGWFHGYMRMLWGKKILEWCRNPADALARMEHLMSRYSLDGRDPISSGSYAWVLGLYDRPWPERPVFGVVRSMTSQSARRKLKLKAYLTKYAAEV